MLVEQGEQQKRTRTRRAGAISEEERERNASSASAPIFADRLQMTGRGDLVRSERKVISLKQECRSWRRPRRASRMHRRSVAQLPPVSDHRSPRERLRLVRTSRG